MEAACGHTKHKEQTGVHGCAVKSPAPISGAQGNSKHNINAEGRGAGSRGRGDRPAATPIFSNLWHFRNCSPHLSAISVGVNSSARERAAGTAMYTMAQMRARKDCFWGGSMAALWKQEGLPRYRYPCCRVRIDWCCSLFSLLWRPQTAWVFAF